MVHLTDRVQERKVPGFSPSGSYRYFIDRASLAGIQEAASPVLERLYALASQETDASMKQQVLADLAPSQAETGDLGGALRTVRQMSDEARPPRALALMDAIDVQGRLGDAAGVRMTENKIPRNSWYNLTLQRYARALAAAGDSVGAVEAANRITVPEERAFGLAQVALQQTEKHDPAAAQNHPFGSRCGASRGSRARLSDAGIYRSRQR
jgi:hypothetical protein